MNDPNKDASIAEAKQEEKKLCVVIPYSREAHWSDALLYTIRSLCAYLLADFRIVVIGDKEDWFSPELVHVPASFSPVNMDSVIDAVVAKVTLEEKISGEFILMMPDTFLLNPLSVHHLMIPKVSESFKFDTGLPFMVDVKLVVQYLTAAPDEPLTLEVCRKCSTHGRPVVVDWRRNEWLLPVVSSRPDAKKFAELADKRFFLRFSKEGWSEFLQAQLHEMFPLKSRYEV